MSIILLRGFSTSGKDFVGQILCEKYNYRRFAFADSLKEIVAEKFKCSVDILHSQSGKIKICDNDPLKRTYRQILIDEALELRNKDSGIFGKLCCDKINSESDIPDKIVITDWRYPNEFEILKQRFPKYIITPVNIIRFDQITSPVNDNSEYELNNRKFDYIIYNYLDDTIYKYVEKLIEYIRINEHIRNDQYWRS
jgi:hypothetical protein